MGKTLQALLAALALASPIAPLPARAQDQEVRKQDSIEDSVRSAVRQQLKKENAKVSIDELKPDWKAYDDAVLSFPPGAQELAKKYRETGDSFWYGFLKVDDEQFVGLFERTGKLNWLEPVSAFEEKFIRCLYDFSHLKLKKPDVDAGVLKKIDDDYAAFHDALVGKAKSDKEFGAKVDDNLAKLSKEALERAGASRIEFLKAMSMMNERELVFALSVLPLMDNPRYGFAQRNTPAVQDLQTVKAEAFLDDVRASSQALDEFPWAKKDALANWTNYVQGVINPRFTNEPHVPGMRRLFFSAAKELAKGAKSYEEALERMVVAVRKAVRYSPGFAWEDGSNIDFLRSHFDRCEKQADFGSMLCRAMGIPSFEAIVLWWPQMHGNHAWQVSEIDGRTFSFLIGEHYERLVNGKPDLHVYDLGRHDLDSIEVDGKILRAIVAAKVHKLVNALKESRLEDITHNATAVTSFTIGLGDDYANKKVYLSVYNSGMARPVASQVADMNGFVKFEKVGCRPWPPVKVDGKDVYDGLLYYITNEQGQFLTEPFTLMPTGRTRSVKMYGFGKDLAEINGLFANAEYDVRVIFKKDGKFDGHVLGKHKSSDSGVLELPGVEDGSLLYLKESAKGADDLRPWVVRKESDGKLYAHKR